jgi:leader peptidase (prepilin peptidase)/N-methyltransferase
MVVVAELVAGVLGALTGAGIRAVLARMRRGAVVAPGWCEVGVAVLWGLPVLGVALGRVEAAWLPTALGFGGLAVAAGATDVVHRRLPDRLTLPAAVLAPVALLPLGVGAAGVGVLGAVVFLVAHAVVHLVTPSALGAGDVKLAASLGAPLAAASWWALLVVPLLAALGVTVWAARGGRGTGRGVPFGPPMLAATWGVIAVVVLAR